MTQYEIDSLALLAKIERHLASLSSGGIGAPAQPRPVGGGRGPLTPFSEEEIRQQGEWGDPEIKFTPKRDWPHGDIAGQYMSRLAPQVLRDYAANLADYAAYCDRENRVDAKGRPKGDFPWKDSRRALYHAAKNERGGARALAPSRVAAAPAPAYEQTDFGDGEDDRIPF